MGSEKPENPSGKSPGNMEFFRDGARPLHISIAVVAVATVFFLLDYFLPGKLITNSPEGRQTMADFSAAVIADRVKTAEERSQNVKGVYMTSVVANDNGRAATFLRNNIIKLVDETELNGVVIDVKETEGGFILTDNLRDLIKTLHEKNAWVIARLSTLKDSSQEKNHPEWYLQRKDNTIWRDNRRGSWLDPASHAVWDYQIGLAKEASDAGFDEIQFDYIRFPSDGDVQNAVYPVYDGTRPKYEVLREFFTYLNQNLKSYRPDLAISADLFGYVAVQHSDLGIGQRLADIGSSFDYVSLMVYPSHYYAGFQVPADLGRNLGPVYFPYRSANIATVASNQPFEVVYRSMLSAKDALDGIAMATSSPNQEMATSSDPTSAPPQPASTAKLRPWLQDFDLGADSSRGIYYDAKKVRAEIDAAEQSGASGWLLWNAGNVYTKEALKAE